MTTDEQKLKNLENQIKYAEENGLSIEEYVLAAINILQDIIDQFLNEMEKQGRMNAPEVARIEIRQYATMKSLAQKINHPVDKYDEQIKKAQCRIIGEENWETFFKFS